MTLHDRLRAAGPPPSFDHLHDPDLLQRLGGDAVRKDLAYSAAEYEQERIPTSGEDAEPVTRTRKRRPSVASVIRQMKRAGVEVAGCEVTRDGVRIVSGKPVGITDSDITDTTTDPTWN